MSWSELHRTLTELVMAVQAPPDAGLHVARAELSVPLEATLARSADGLVLLGRVPHSRWQSGFLPEIHTGHLVVEAVDEASG